MDKISAALFLYMHFKNVALKNIITPRNKKVLHRNAYEDLLAIQPDDKRQYLIEDMVAYNYFGFKFNEITYMTDLIKKYFNNLEMLRKKVCIYNLYEIFLDYQREKFNRIDIYVPEEYYCDIDHICSNNIRNRSITTIVPISKNEPIRYAIPYETIYTTRPMRSSLYESCIVRFINSEYNITVLVDMKEIKRDNKIYYQKLSIDSDMFETEFLFYTGIKLKHWISLDMTEYKSPLLNGFDGIKQFSQKKIISDLLEEACKVKEISIIEPFFKNYNPNGKKIGFSTSTLTRHIHIISKDVRVNMEYNKYSDYIEVTASDKSGLTTIFDISNHDVEILASFVNNLFKIKFLDEMKPIKEYIPSVRIRF